MDTADKADEATRRFVTLLRADSLDTAKEMLAQSIKHSVQMGGLRNITHQIGVDSLRLIQWSSSLNSTYSATVLLYEAPMASQWVVMDVRLYGEGNRYWITGVQWSISPSSQAESPRLLIRGQTIDTYFVLFNWNCCCCFHCGCSCDMHSVRYQKEMVVGRRCLHRVPNNCNELANWRALL